MHSLSWVRSAAAVISAATPAGDPAADRATCVFTAGVRLPVSGHRTPDTGNRPLPLTELEPLPRARAPGLLPLHHPWIARQQSVLPQLLAMPVIREAQRPGDAQPQRARLPRHAAAPHQRANIERAERIGRRERLLDVRHERWPGEIIPQRAPIDIPLPRPRR